VFQWLNNFPNFVIALLFGLCGAVIAAAAPFFREKVLRVQVSRDRSEAVRIALDLVIYLTGLVLAFSFNRAQGDQRSLETQVATEAHNLAQMDRLLLRYGDPGNGSIRVSLRDYADSIVKDEWPELREGRSSQRTAALFRPISRGILAMVPMDERQILIYAEMLKKVDEIAADRKARLAAAAQLQLPSIFWLIITFLLGILLVMATFTEATLGRAVALAGLGSALGLLVALVFMFDEPFRGEISLSPKPISDTVAEMQARTE
jgi:uncharacterized integral membrane protein